MEGANERSVPSVSVDKRRRATDSLPVASALPSFLPLRRRCEERLYAGAKKYGLSWNHVDLKTDLKEELEDAANYVAFMIGRLVETGLLDLPLNNLLVQIRDQIEEVYALVGTLPEFEGPTSADWVEWENTHPLMRTPQFYD